MSIWNKWVSEVTRVLNEIQQGNPAAASDLLPLVYSELRRLARIRMQKEATDQTLQATALVHEAYLRLVGEQEIQWNGRGHFFGAAAEAMRRILVENARRRRSLKRGGGRARHDLCEGDLIAENDGIDELLDLDDALNRLAEEEPELAKLVELRYFAGLSVEETAKALAISPRTVKRHWAFVRAWLGQQLSRKSDKRWP